LDVRQGRLTWQITLTPFWRGRIIKPRDALSQKAIAVFYFNDENANLTFLSQSSRLSNARLCR
jgi:hypothetical protein